MTTRKKRTVKTIPNGPLETTIRDLVSQVGTLQHEVTRLSYAQMPGGTTPIDKSKEVAALVGLWIDRQKASGQTTVDLKRVDDIRTGIELALS